MTGDDVHHPNPPAFPKATDVRGIGFPRRAALSDAWRWIDGVTRPPRPVAVPLADAAGRRLAAAVTASLDWPPADRAARDGAAVAAHDTLGAGSYNPIPLPGAAVLSAGDPLPPGADAVLPVEAVQTDAGFVEALGTVAPGEGVERRGEWARAGTTLLEAGRVLRPADVGLLAALGVGAVTVAARPTVRVVLAGGPRHGTDALGPMLAALVARDGGVATVAGPFPAERGALAGALAAPGADLVLCAGRGGLGADDVAPLALADAGVLVVHGIAMRPGDSAGFGMAAEVPVLLLPGEPMAGLAAYELLAGRAVRRMAGERGALPHRRVEAVAARKLVSEIGCVDLYRVRRAADGGVEPVASPAVPGLAGAARADGFVLIPAESEGIPAGAAVTVHCFDEDGFGATNP